MKERTDKGAAGKGGSGRRRVVLAAYAVWVTVILMASVPYLAEQGTRKAMGDGEFEYNPMFDHNGTIEHYDVKLVHAEKPAFLDLKYDHDAKTVEIEAENIEELTVDCTSIATKHGLELMDEEDADEDLLFHDFFYETLGKIIVEIDASNEMEITWKDMPIPTVVIENGEEYTGELPTDTDEFVVTCPEGENVYVLYFDDTYPDFPKAVISVDHQSILEGGEVEFDGSNSLDGEGVKGKIQDYIWDLDTADAVNDDSDQVSFKHTFEKKGTYNVSLTVRNDYDLKHTAYIDIEVSEENKDIDMDGDGTPDWDDDDIDGDGYPNDLEDDYEGADRLDRNAIPPDMDGDYIPDDVDDDRDGDNVTNDEDPDPDDANVFKEPEAQDDDENKGLLGMGPMVDVVLILVIVIIVVGAAAGAVAAKSSAAKKAAAAQAAAAQQAAAQQAAAPPPGEQGAEMGYGAPPPQEPVYTGYEELGAPGDEAAMGAADAGAFGAGGMDGSMEGGDLAGALEGGAEFGPEMSRDEYVAGMDQMAMSEYGYSEEELAGLHEALDEAMALGPEGGN